jgi:uncharacterized protein YebE (UPF0316 family)
MDTFNQFLKYFFILSALLIIVVYFVGFSTNVNVLGHVFQVLSYAFTGRNAAGNFGSYPTGATLPAGITG